MASEQRVDVSYRGLEVGRGLQLSHVGPRTAYLALDAPMPVGSELQLAVTDGPRITVRVLRVQEHARVLEHAGELPPGMRLGVIGLDEEARAWWEALVTEADPVIPEPAGGHASPAAPEVESEPAAEGAAAGAEAAAAEGAAAEAAETESAGIEAAETEAAAGAEAAGTEAAETVAAETESVGIEAAGAGDTDDGEAGAADAAGGRRARTTEVMSASEIDAIVQDAGGEPAAGTAEGMPEGGDDTLAAEEPGAPAGELEAQGKAKNKKRRRRPRNRR